MLVNQILSMVRDTWIWAKNWCIQCLVYLVFAAYISTALLLWKSTWRWPWPPSWLLYWKAISPESKQIWNQDFFKKNIVWPFPTLSVVEISLLKLQHGRDRHFARNNECIYHKRYSHWNEIWYYRMNVRRMGRPTMYRAMLHACVKFNKATTVILKFLWSSGILLLAS